MTKNYWLTLTVFHIMIFCSYVFPQNSAFRLRLNYVINDMSYFKDLEKEINEALNNEGLEAKIFGNYGAQLGWQLQYTLGLDRATSIGFMIEFLTTGSRIFYSDYSGVLRSDKIFSRYGAGLLFEKKFPLFANVSIIVSTQIFYNLTALEFIDYTKVYNQENKSNEDFTFWAVSTTNGGGIQFDLPRALIRFELGYDYTIHMEHKPPFEEMWNGFRPGLTLGFKL